MWDYGVAIGQVERRTTLDSLPGGGSPDLFYLQINFNGANSGSAGFIGAEAAGAAWNRLTLQGNIPSGTTTVKPLFVVADGGFGGAAPNGTGTGAAVHVDSFRVEVGALSGSLVAAESVSQQSIRDAVFALLTDAVSQTANPQPISPEAIWGGDAVGDKRTLLLLALETPPHSDTPDDAFAVLASQEEDETEELFLVCRARRLALMGALLINAPPSQFARRHKIDDLLALLHSQ